MLSRGPYSGSWLHALEGAAEGQLAKVGSGEVCMRHSFVGGLVCGLSTWEVRLQI